MITSEEPSYDSLKHIMVRGAAWMIGMRWLVRVIGLVNTIILARILTPEDFGVIAMAAVAVSFLDSIVEFNAETALVRTNSADRSQYDSAWTLQVIEGTAKAVVLIGVAPLLAAYYGDPRIETIVFILALRPFIEGFENIGQVDFRRDLQFSKDFRYWVYRRLLSFVLSLAVVLWMRNYIALAIAAPITAISTVALSYVMSSYRPRLAWSHIGEIWAFSQWWMVFGAVRFFGGRGEEVILGRLTTPQIVGAYSVGNDFSGLLIGETVLPTVRAFTPGYAKMSDRPAQLLATFRLSFGILLTISLVMGLGASLVAKDLVPAVLGSQWYIAIPFFQMLALHHAAWSVVNIMQPYFFVTKQERLYALANVGYLLVLLPAIAIASRTTGAAEIVALAIAQARAASTAFFMFAMFGVLLALRVFTVRTLIDLLWRPAIACGVMAISVKLVSLSETVPHVLSLAVHVGIGATTFLVIMALLWMVAGRPVGTETAVWNLVVVYGRALFRRSHKIADD